MCGLKLELEKKKQTEEFLTNLGALSTDLSKLNEKIQGDVSDLKKSSEEQNNFMNGFFKLLGSMMDEIREKYANRINKTFSSIKDIYLEKANTLSKFEKEMKELEKDVRLNYSNIIKLMDLDPFYEIIYRYNKKLGTIKSVFNEFKGKPDEIPESAIRIKPLTSQLVCVSYLKKQLEGFFYETDNYESNNTSREWDNADMHLAKPELETQSCFSLSILGKKEPKYSPKSHRANQTENFQVETQARKKRPANGTFPVESRRVEDPGRTAHSVCRKSDLE